MCWRTISGREAMHIDDFDFDLPRERIALQPSEPRDAARLLVIPASGGFEDRRISDLPTLLHPGDLLVFNDTKVIPARLTGRRGEAVVEITLCRDLGDGSWRAFAKGARRLRTGDRFSCDKAIALHDVARRQGTGRLRRTGFVATQGHCLSAARRRG